MTLILKQIFGLLKILNSENGEKQIALGICCGLILGFAPVLSLQTILVIIIILIFKIQAGAAFGSAFFFALVAFLLDPLFDLMGGYFLEIEALYPLYETLYNLPIIPFTKFNNSIVMGAAVVSVLMTPFVYFISRSLIVKYRKTFVARFKQTKLWKFIKATAFYKWYVKYDEYFG